MAEDTEYIKLPLLQRCSHKLWKARVHGYTEAVKLFQEEEDDKAAIFGQFAGLLSKLVGDSNVAAQEKGLEATLYFVQCSALAGKTVKDVMPAIIAKSIAAPKKSTQDLSAQIALMYIEVEKQEAVIEELVKGLEHKNPKIVAACLNVLTLGLREFGSQVVSIKPLVKPVLALLEHRDKTVRDEAKVLIVEIYRWVGEAIKPQLSKLQPIQLTELETEFAKAKGTKAIPTRYLRSQQAKKAKALAAVEEVDGDEVEGTAEVVVDPLSLIDPINVLSKIPNDFYEKLEAKKWQERKEAVEALDQILDYPKFEKGDYGELVRALLKVINKDTNVVVVGITTKCLARLASGLKRGFQPYANSCIPQLLAKFKEKKANVVTPLREAVDAAFYATNLEAIQEDIIASLDNKNPTIKAETASFLGRCFAQCTPSILNKKLLKALVTALLKTLNEPDPIVRDNSAEALGIAMKVVGEKVILPFLPDIDPLKLSKIKECCEKAVVKTAPAAKVAKPAAPPPKADPPKKVLSGGAITRQAAKVQKPVEPVESEISTEEVDVKAAEYLPEDVLTDLSSTDWKKRLEKMEIFENVLTNMEPSSIAAEVMAKILAKKPGLKDNNFQVLKIKLDCLKHIAETFPMGKPVVELVVADVTEKLADPKNGVLAGETLMALAEAANLDIVGSLVLEYAFSQKSVKIQQEALDWTGEAVQNFGLIMNTATLVNYMKKGLNSTNSGVRQSAAGLAGISSLYLGQQLLKLLDEKPTVVALITAEIDKRDGEEPLEPSRTCKIDRPREATPVRVEAPRAKVVQQVEEEEEEESLSKQEKAKPAARVDISAKITEQLLGELGDKNWKVRSEALVNLQSMVSDAGAIKSNLGELPAALALRFVDSNAKLSVMALELCTSLAVALGPSAKNVVRNFARGIFTALGDNKPPVRSAALTCLKTWAAEAGAKEFFSGEVIPDTLKAGSTSLKVELWNWLGETLPAVRGLPKDELCLIIPYLFSGIEDRSPDVRKAANSAVCGLMLHVGYGNMLKEVDKLKPASKAGIVATLEKVRPEVPDPTPVKAKAEIKGKPANKVVPSSAKKATVVAPVKPTARKKEEDVDTSPLLQINKLKYQRMNDEIKLKVLKWNFSSPRPEFVELLRDQMTAAGFNKNLMNNMFHSDFKFHLKALELLVEDLDNQDALISNLDLILKWLTLRFFDTNPSVLLKGLEYLQTVFASLIDIDYAMSDVEVTSFIPYLVLKVGDPKDTVRDRVHTIMKQFSRMYTPKKLFLLIMDGLKSKNSRQRTECLEELGYLIEEFGTTVCMPSPAVALKEISKQIADRDNAVRSAALNAIVKAYFVDGDKIYKMIGQLSDKDMSYLEERIKRASKNRTTKPVGEEKSMLVTKADDRRIPEPEPYIEEEIEEEEEPEKEASVEESRRVKEDSIRQPSPRVIPIVFKFPENTVTKIPDLDLVEIDYSVLEEPVYIPENILRKMEKTPPTNPVFQSVLRDASSLNLDIAFEGLKKLYSTIVAPDVGDMLVPYSKNIFATLNSQLKACNQFSLATHGPILAQVYKVILRTIGEIFGKSALATHADEQDLKSLIHEMVITYVENKTADFPENCYNQWIVVFLSRVLTMSDKTAVTCALVNELYDLVGNPPANQKITDLTTKCLLKIITTLKKEPNLDQVINLDKVLYSCHLFMQSYPRYTWKDRPSDMPLKGIKTLLLNLVQMKGTDILLHLRSIENPITSELSAYVKRMLVNKPVSQVTKAASDQLAEIFMKIGSEDNVKEGMIELYEFKQAHPEIDLNPIISATSQHFQDFVAQSLKEIEKERGPLKKAPNVAGSTQGTSPSSSATPNQSSTPPTDFHQMPMYYLNRLRTHQKRLGMPLSNIPGLESNDANSN